VVGGCVPNHGSRKKIHFAHVDTRSACATKRRIRVSTSSSGNSSLILSSDSEKDIAVGPRSHTTRTPFRKQLPASWAGHGRRCNILESEKSFLQRIRSGRRGGQPTGYLWRPQPAQATHVRCAPAAGEPAFGPPPDFHQSVLSSVVSVEERFTGACKFR
jgi:hypothetical protein